MTRPIIQSSLRRSSAAAIAGSDRSSAKPLEPVVQDRAPAVQDRVPVIQDPAAGETRHRRTGISRPATKLDLRLPGSAGSQATIVGWRWRSLRVLGLAGIFLWRWRRPAPISSIAVLPFDNLSAPSFDDAFSDGLTDEIAASVSHLDGVRVAGAPISVCFQRQARRPARDWVAVECGGGGGRQCATLPPIAPTSPSN